MLRYVGKFWWLNTSPIAGIIAIFVADTDVETIEDRNRAMIEQIIWIGLFDSLSPLFLSNTYRTYSPCQLLFRMGKVLMYNEKVAGEQDIPRRGRGMSEQWTMEIYVYIYIPSGNLT